MSNRRPPVSVMYAVYALAVWTVWTCGLGIYQSLASIPEIEKTLTEQLQGAVSIDAHTMIKAVFIGYVIIGLLSAWVVVGILYGKHWARSSFAWGFGLQVLILLCPPYQKIGAYILDFPDYALQAYATVLLYRKPGSDWFVEPKKKSLGAL